MNPVRYLQAPKGWLKREFVQNVFFAFQIFVTGNRRHLKFSMPIYHSKSLPTDDKLSMKLACTGHVNHLHYGGHQSFLWSGCSYSHHVMYTGRIYQVPAYIKS